MSTGGNGDGRVRIDGWEDLLARLDRNHAELTAGINGLREDVQGLSTRFDNLLATSSGEVRALRAAVQQQDERLRVIEERLGLKQ